MKIVSLAANKSQKKSNQSQSSNSNVANGGGPPYDGDMEKRLTVLETKLETLLPTLATKGDIAEIRLATKADMAEIKSEIHKSAGDTHKWMIGTVIGLFLGFGGLFLAMSNALKPASHAPQQAPIIIQTPTAPTPPPPSQQPVK